MRFTGSRAAKALGAFVLSMILMGLVGGCDNDRSATRLPDSQSSRTADDSESFTSATKGQLGQILVADPQGQPVVGARILIGQAPGSPFAGNLLLTDKTGSAQVPSAWSAPEPVTIEAPGHVRATYFDRTPETALVLTIRRRPAADSTFELAGETTGYGQIRDDGWLDVALVMPAFSRGQVATMHVTDIFSKEFDVLSVLDRQQRIPANLSVPTQTKTYIFPIRLSKPQYRLQFNGGGSRLVEGLHARVKISEAVDHIRNGGGILDLVNKFKFTEGGIVKANVQKGGSRADLPVNGFAIKPSAVFTAPNFDPNLDMFSLVFPKTEGPYVISDIKKLKPNARVELSTPVGASQGMIAHLLRKRPANNGDILTGPEGATQSMILVSSSRAQPLEFLDIVAPPARQGKTGLTLTPPSRPAKIAGAMTYLLLSKVEVIDNGSYKLEKTAPEWELYGNDWMTNVSLPELPPLDRGEGTAPQMRWEASFAGQMGASGRESAPGPEEFEKATHVTRSALDF